MKKRFLFVSLTIVLLAIFGITFTSCNKKGGDLDISANVSYAETYKFTGADDNFRISVVSGLREKLFLADGAATDVGAFSMLSVTPLKTDLLQNEYTFTVLYEGGEVQGALSKDPVSNGFIADIDLGDNVAKITSVKLTSGENTAEIAVTNQLIDKLTYQQVLDIAKSEFADAIKAATTDGVFNREIMLKLIRDKRNPDSPYYWYVSFIAADNSYWAILLDPATGEIISKKA